MPLAELKPSDLLSDVRALPFFRFIPMTQLRVPSAVAAHHKMYGPSLDQPYDQYVKPEMTALQFYLMNSVMAEVIRTQPAGQPLNGKAALLSDYLKFMEEHVPRMFFYLMYITAREARHVVYGPIRFATHSVHEHLGHSLEEMAICGEFVSHLSDNPESDVQEFKQRKPGVTNLSLAQFAEAAFAHGQFSSNYGGAPWKRVASVLKNFLLGEITGEMLLDTAFTLAHNNGPIFNKSMLYHNVDASRLKRVLDYQHEGRVQMALDLLPNMELSEYLGRARKHLPEFGVPKTKKVPVYYGKSALETTPLYKDKVKVGKSALETAADAMNALTESTYATDDALSKFVSGSFKPPKQKVSIKELNQPVYHLDTEGFPTYAGTVSTVTFTAPATEISEDDPNLVSVSYSVNGPDQPIMAEVTMIKKTGGIEDYVSKK